MKKKFPSLIFLFALLARCISTPATNSPAPVSTTASTAWWNDTVFYEIFVRSFYDSNGDGIGDFNGITQKLDYLNDGDPNTTTDLGVTGIWLMPIFPSPSYHGYDVTDYYSVNPQYGTMDDFKNLLKEAHKRNIKVIIDLVINHTSDQHPWFKSAKKDPNSPYRNWYIWNEIDPKYKGPWGEKVWHPSLTGYYYGIFESFMPDLNYRNPAVTQEMEKAIKFWLAEVGVDGFRMDAVKHLIEEGSKQENTVSTHLWLKDNFYPAYKGANPNALAVGELFGDDMNAMASYVTGRQFDLAFNFQLADSFIGTSNSRRSSFAINTLKLSEKAIPNHQYAAFLTNHDQNRVMSQLGNDVNKAKVAATLLLTSPGVSFIYYGEEIGMTGQKPDANIRRPMQWSGDENAGFTAGKPWQLPDVNYTKVNVISEKNDPGSLFAYYRELIQLRSRHPALQKGNIYFIDTGNPQVYAVLRVDKSETILVLINLTDQPIQDFELALNDAILANGSYKADLLFSDGQVSGLKVKRGVFQNYKPVNELAPHAALIVQFQP